MTANQRVRRATSIIVLAWCVAGCGSGAPKVGTPEAGTEEALRQVGESYRSYTATKNKPPQKVADLMILRQAEQAGAAAIKNGSVVVLWDAKMNDLSEDGSKDPADEILAYEKDVPAQGGQVLMLNRTIKKMTADEFKAAKKAGKETPAGADTKKK